MTPTTANTTLPLRWRLPARTAWLLLAAACLTLFAISTAEAMRTPMPQCSAPGANCVATLMSLEDVQTAAAMGWPYFLPLALAASLVARLSLAIVGLLIAWRKADDWLALIVSGALLTVLTEGAHMNDATLNALLDVALAVGTALFLPLPFIFPNGRWVPHWTLWPGLLVTAATVILTLAFTALSQYATLPTILNLLWVALSIYAMTFRYFRVSTMAERQQIKWVLLGITALFVSTTYYTVFYVVFPISQPSPARVIALLVQGVFYVLCYSFFAFSFIVAILRYRLWDIDLIIRRTLQYSLISGLLALTYFGLITVLQGIFRAISNQQSEISIVLSTLAIAALFFPLRNRVQEFIDKRFYRKKYDAQKVLAEFAATCRDETDLDKLTARLVEVIDETLQPEKVSVWIKPPAAIESKLEKNL